MDPVLLSEVVELLEGCSNYFYERADADDGMPNKAMRLMNDCDEMLSKLALKYGVK
jgi:hypothetical protein